MTLVSAEGGNPLLGEHNQMKEKAALVSVFVKTLLFAGKLIAGLLSGSLALLSEAANNLGDIGITLFSFISIRIANRPADEEHHYGHAKVEALAALIETGFLFGLAVYICATSFNRLTGAEPIDVEPGLLSYGVLVVSIVVDSFRWYQLDRVAKLTKSDALAADALNFSSDIVAATLALFGLAAVQFGYPQGDAIAALGVGLFIGIAGFGLGRRTINTLTDAAPPGLTEEVRALAAEVPGVIRVESLRLRPGGAEVFGDISVFVPRTVPLERVSEIKNDIKTAISSRYPEVSLTITAQPVALQNETIIERLLLIAAKRHVPIHHIIVQEIGGRTTVGFDIEIDGTMPHGRAHEVVMSLEADIHRELGADIEIETHLEPLEPNQLSGSEASSEAQGQISAALAKRAAESGVITNVHNVRVSETPSGLVVSYHCCVDPKLNVDEVHSYVDELDHSAQAEFSEIARIIGHATPVILPDRL